MIKLVCVFLFAIAAQGQPVHRKELHDKISKISNACVQQTGMNPQILRDVLATEKMPEKSETYLSFVECLYRKQNYVDDNGLILYPNIENFLSHYIESGPLRKVMGACETLQNGTSVGERAFNAGNCILTQLHAVEAQTAQSQSSESVESSEEHNTV